MAERKAKVIYNWAQLTGDNRVHFTLVEVGDGDKHDIYICSLSEMRNLRPIGNTEPYRVDVSDPFNPTFTLNERRDEGPMWILLTGDLRA